MNRKVKATVPKLNNRGGDPLKDWFVHYLFWNERSCKYEKIRIYKGFAIKKTAKAKTRFGNELIKELTFKLKNGYNPIAEKEEEFIFYDEIEYSNVAYLGGRNKRENNTVNFFANKFLASIGNEIAPSSYTTYQSKLRVFIYWLKSKKLGDVDITTISPKHIHMFFDYLSNIRKIKNSRKFYREMIFRVFETARKEHIIKNNPVTEIQIKKKQPLPPRYFQEKSLQQMKKYMLEHDPQLWLAARFIFYCFIRPKELRFLKIGDIYIKEGMIRIRPEVSKTGKERNPVIPEKFRQELIQENILDYPENYFLISRKTHPDTKGVSKNYLWEHFNKMRKNLGIPTEFKFYGFKHTGMIMTKKSGADTKDIQMQAGHHSLDMVDKYINQMMPVESDHLRYNGPQI